MYFLSQLGVEFLFQSLLKQVSASTLPQLEKRRNEVKGSISLLFSEALPDEAAMAQKAKEIINSAISYLQDSKSSRERLLSTSSSVIELTNIDPESVPPIPSRLKSKPATLKEAYVSTCLSSWKSEKEKHYSPPIWIRRG